MDGAHGLIVRPSMLRGYGDHGHVTAVYRSVATTGAACHVGEGLNTYDHSTLTTTPG